MGIGLDLYLDRANASNIRITLYTILWPVSNVTGWSEIFCICSNDNIGLCC
jgi:hypothetical protein